MKKSMVWVLLLLGMWVSTAGANGYRETEKPVWGILGDTAYNLNSGEWNIDLWGPVTYGITDQIQVGSIFWVWFAQVPNINAKINILKEMDGLPALSVGGSYWAFGYDHTDSTTNQKTTIDISWFSLSAIVSKQLNETFYLTGSYIYNALNASASVSQDDNALLSLSGTGDHSQVVANLVAQMSPIARFYAELSADLYSEKTVVQVGGAFEWALGEAFRLKLGIYKSLENTNNSLLPLLDLYWRFQ